MIITVQIEDVAISIVTEEENEVIAIERAKKQTLDLWEKKRLIEDRLCDDPEMN